MLTSTISPTGGVTVMVRPAIFWTFFCKSNLADVIANVYYLYGRCCCHLCLMLYHQSGNKSAKQTLIVVTSPLTISQ